MMELKDLRALEAEKLKLEIDALVAEKIKAKTSRTRWRSLFTKMEFIDT